MGRRLTSLTVTLALLAVAAFACAGCGGGSNEVAPKGSVYSYRIPPEFQKAKLLRKPNGTVSFPTATASAKADKHRGEGISVGQIAAPVTVVNTAALRAARNEVDAAFRAPVAAETGATISAPTFTQIAGHPAVRWTGTGGTTGPLPDLDFRATIVFAGPKAVEVACRWGRTAAERRFILHACDALLASLHLKGGKPASTASSADPQAAAVTALLQAVFAHPKPGQCATAMTPAYLSATFGELTHGERKVASTTKRVCEIHQHDRATLMTPALREVTLEHLTINGAVANAMLRGTNGYPIDVALTHAGGAWRLDAPGGAPTGPGSGKEVAPNGSLYAYRIPSGFRPGRVAINGVDVTGSAFSTGVISPKAPGRGEGVAVGQTTFRLSVHDAAELRAQLPGFTSAFRRILRATGGVELTSAPAATQVGGRPAMRYTSVFDGAAHETTIVFSTAVPEIVAVNCVSRSSAGDIAEVRRGCDAVLGSLRVK